MPSLCYSCGALGGAVRAENVGGAEMQAARGLSLGVVSVARECFCVPSAVGGVSAPFPWG